MMDYNTLIIYALTNAYDVYSAAALSHLKHLGKIQRIEIYEHGGYIFTNHKNEVEQVLKKHDMFFKTVDLSWLNMEN